jgi:hypothetical protein
MSFPKVTVVRAGQVGAMAARLLLLHDVVMIDVAEAVDSLGLRG